MKYIDEILDEEVTSYINNDKSVSFMDVILEKNEDCLKKYIISRLESLDDIFSKKRDKKKIIIIHSKKKRTALTKIGKITYRRNYYKDKETGKYFYYVDKLLGLENYDKVDISLKKEVIKKSVDLTYHKASKELSSIISSQTAHNIVKNNYKKFNNNKNNKSKKVLNLQIEADEDHIHLKNNKNKLAKLAYIHEGYDLVDGKVTLINPVYFTDLGNGIWDKVKSYINLNYSFNKLTINGDGASWIKNAKKFFKNSKFFLDKFHLFKSIRNISKEKEIQNRIIKSIREKDKSYLKSIKNEFNKKDVNYILNNFNYIDLDNSRCSAEGHISHIFSSRLSSRPMAWSEEGLERMLELRVYKYNKGDYSEIYDFMEKDIINMLKVDLSDFETVYSYYYNFKEYLRKNIS